MVLHLPRCFSRSGYQTNVLYWLACWIGNIAMVVIGVGLCRFLFRMKVVGINHHLRRGAVDLRPAEHCRSKNDRPCAGSCHRAGADPIVGIAVFGWFSLRGETYMAAWNVSGLGTFGAIQSILNVTLWSFIGVESASVAAGVVKNPKRNVLIATIGKMIAAVCYVLSTTAIMGMIPNAALRVSARHSVMPHGWRWVTPPGPLFPSAQLQGLLRFTGRLDVAGGSNGESRCR